MVIVPAKKTDGINELESTVPGSQNGFVEKNPEYDMPLPADEESRRKKNHVHMD